MGKYLSALMESGWTVTFPQFHDKRAYAVEITKGRSKHTAGWINEQSLEDALQRLTEAATIESEMPSC